VEVLKWIGYIAGAIVGLSAIISILTILGMLGVIAGALLLVIGAALLTGDWVKHRLFGVPRKRPGVGPK
jgi:hypothetical protein